MIQLPTNQTNTGQLLHNNVSSTVWSPSICSKHLIIECQTQNRKGIVVKSGVWVKQTIVVHLSGYGDLQSEISLIPRWSRDVVS